jgi:hypothetical protein
MKASELDLILKLRLAVARLGETDRNAWWNSYLLSRTGQISLGMMFPRTTRIAQARSAFLVARERCQSVLGQVDCSTLWNLSAEIEEQLDQRLDRLTSKPEEWQLFFEQIANLPQAGVAETLDVLGLVDPSSAEVPAPEITGQSASVQLPGKHPLDLDAIRLLALAFQLGKHNQLVVPFIRNQAA